MTGNLIQHIEVRPCGSGGAKACIVGTGISVADIYVRHEIMGETPDRIVVALPHLTLAQVHAALAYFYDHPAEIRGQLHDQDAFVARLKSQTGPGPLERKLQSGIAHRAAVSPG